MASGLGAGLEIPGVSQTPHAVFALLDDCLEFLALVGGEDTPNFFVFIQANLLKLCLQLRRDLLALRDLAALIRNPHAPELAPFSVKLLTLGTEQPSVFFLDGLHLLSLLRVQP